MLSLLRPLTPWGRDEVVSLHDRLAGRTCDDVDQLIDGYKFVCAEVERRGAVGLHDAKDALDAIVNVHERPGLLTVAPNLDLVAVLAFGDLAADRGRRLLATAIVGAEGP